MCLLKGTFVGKRNFDVIKMHGKTIKIYICIRLNSNFIFKIVK